MTGGIVIVIESLGGGGAQHVATTLANAWVTQGMDVTVITFQDADGDVFRLDPGARRVVIGGAGSSFGIIAAAIANIRRIRMLRVALKCCHGHAVLAFVGSTNIIAILASMGLGYRVIVSERNDPQRQSIGKVWDALRRVFYRRADLVVANSQAAIDTMSTYVPPNRLRWLPNPLRAAPCAPQDGVTVQQPFFLAVGRLNRQKGYDNLLAAFAIVAARLPEWRLVVLGDGPLRSELDRQSSELAIADRAHFAGYVANPFPWYRAAAGLVHAAHFEGLPNAVLEAMSVGTPVVVTDAQVGLEGIVRNNESGLVVPVGSSDALADAMLRLASELDLRRRLGDAGQAAVIEFRPDRAIAAWTALLT